MDNNLKTTLTKLRQGLDNRYAKPNGNYPTMTVGEADALTPYGENSGANDTTPFVFQTTGGSSDVGSKAYLKALRGNTVVWNQQISKNLNGFEVGLNMTISKSNGIITFSTTNVELVNVNHTIVKSFDIINGHRYLIKEKVTLNQGDYSKYRNPRFSISSSAQVSTVERFDINFSTTNSGYISFIFDATATKSEEVQIFNTRVIESGNSVVMSGTIEDIIFIDLTLLGKSYSSIVDFNRDYPLPYYSINTGTLLSCKVNKIKNVGYNAYDNANPNDYIKVVAGQKYTLEGSGSVTLYDGNKTALTDTFVSESALPNNCCYVKITGGDNTTCFHLTWDGSRTGHEPYEVNEYNLPNVELRSAGSVYDELKPDGTLTRRIGSYTFTGQEDWSVQSNYNDHCYGFTLSGVKQHGNTSTKANILCDSYATISNNGNITASKGISLYTNFIRISDSSYINNLQGFKSYIAGKTIYFELATPITTQSDDYKYQESQDIDDFGTQEFLYDNDIAIPVPQGNEFFYPVDYKAFIDSLGGREDIEYDASQVVSQTQLGVVETKHDNLYAIMKENMGGMLRHQLTTKVKVNAGSLAFRNTAWIDLGTLDWTYSYGLFSSNGLSSLIADITDNYVVSHILCPLYAETYYGNGSSDMGDKTISETATNKLIHIKDSSYTDTTAFKNAMKGVLLAYEKAS